VNRLFDTFCAAAQERRGDFFHADAPIVAATAPGWVDLIGGAAAYGGSLALGWPTGAPASVALQRDPEPVISLVCADQQYRFPCAQFVDATGWPCLYSELTKYVHDAPPPVAALLAIWVALMREEFVRFPGGVRVWLQPADGPGAFAGTTAALAQALVTAFAVKLAPRELALSVAVALAHTSGPAEAGALGPLVSVCAPANQLLLVHQQPAWLWGDVHLPHGAAIWALTVAAPAPPAPLAHLHTAAQLVTGAIAAIDGLAPQAVERRLRGYLANIDSPTFERRYRAALPAVGADAAFPLHAVAALAVDEHLRARTIAALLRAAASRPQRDDDLRLIGELMLQSHWAQRAAGLLDPHADALVEQVTAHGPDQGLFGARAPAPECGATLVILGRSDAEPLVQQLADDYARAVGLPVRLTGGSAPGASPASARTLLP
jgi:galactokinase